MANPDPELPLATVRFWPNAAAEIVLLNCGPQRMRWPFTREQREAQQIGGGLSNAGHPKVGQKTRHKPEYAETRIS